MSAKAVFAGILSNSIQVRLPYRFNADTMLPFLTNMIDEQRRAKAKRVIIDFSLLDFVEPVVVVVLSNVIEYLERKLGCHVSFAIHESKSYGITFLDDSLFFEKYLNRRLNPGSHRVVRRTMVTSLSSLS